MFLETPEGLGRPDSKPRPPPLRSPGTGVRIKRTQTCTQGQPFPLLGLGCPQPMPQFFLSQNLHGYAGCLCHWPTAVRVPQSRLHAARPGLHCDFACLHIPRPLSSHPKPGAQQMLDTYRWSPETPGNPISSLCCDLPHKKLYLYKTIRRHITRCWVSKSTRAPGGPYSPALAAFLMD